MKAEKGACKIDVWVLQCSGTLLGNSDKNQWLITIKKLSKSNELFVAYTQRLLRRQWLNEWVNSWTILLMILYCAFLMNFHEIRKGQNREFEFIRLRRKAKRDTVGGSQTVLEYLWNDWPQCRSYVGGGRTKGIGWVASFKLKKKKKMVDQFFKNGKSENIRTIWGFCFVMFVFVSYCLELFYLMIRSKMWTCRWADQMGNRWRLERSQESKPGVLDRLLVWITLWDQVICTSVPTGKRNMKFVLYFNSPWIDVGTISTLHICVLLFALHVLYQLKG